MRKRTHKDCWTLVYFSFSFIKTENKHFSFFVKTVIIISATIITSIITVAIKPCHHVIYIIFALDLIKDEYSVIITLLWSTQNCYTLF